MELEQTRSMKPGAWIHEYRMMTQYRMMTHHHKQLCQRHYILASKFNNLYQHNSL